MDRMSARAGLPRRVLVLGLGMVVSAGLALAVTAPAQATSCKPRSLICIEPGEGAKPLPKPPKPETSSWVVKYRVWSNHIKIYRDHKLVRDVKVAGNPYLSPHLPSTCRVSQKLRVNWDKTLDWRLNYFTRLCAGRGVGTHAIPIHRVSGRLSMNAADLGKTPGAGAPLSHGCARMTARDAKWIYDRVPLGSLVKISYAR